MLNNYSSRKTHYISLAILLLAVFLFQGWTNISKQHVQYDNGYDFLNYATLGRQLVEYKSAPTFLYPGKTFDGPVKPCSTYFPALVFGYHDWVPVLMISLYGTMICFFCYCLARLFVSRAAGMSAMAIAALLDPYIVNYAFQYAFAFDVMILLDLAMGLLAIQWVNMYRKKSAQPGILHCVALGLVAGLAWYTHPTCIATIGAVGLFLLLSLGAKVFTWRAVVVTLASVFSSIPFWIYCITHSNVSGSWQGYSAKYEREINPLSFLFSKEGYIYFTLSPSGNRIMFFFLLLALGVALCILAMWITATVKNRSQWNVAGALRNGCSIPLAGYGYIAAFCIIVVTFATSGMTKAAFGWLYGIELWFWLVIAGGCVVNRLLNRARPLALLLVVGLMCSLGYSTVTSILDRPLESSRDKWNMAKCDAEKIFNSGHRDVLSEAKEPYIMFALGPSGLNVAASYDPWVTEMAYAVECSVRPGIMANLNPSNLGVDRWESISLHSGEMHHSFQMPDPGKVLSNADWQVKGQERAELLKDHSISTSLIVDADDCGFEVVFDHPRSICRMVFLLDRSGDDWVDYTYPRDIVVTGRLSDGNWVVLTEGVRDDGYFWDGGRLFYAQRQRNRLDVRFKPQEVTAINIRDRDGDDLRPRQISELYMYESTEDRSRYAHSSINDVRRLIKESGAKRVLADRFVSAQIGASLDGVHIWKPPFLRFNYGEGLNEEWPWFPSYESIEGSNTVIVADSAMGSQVSESLLSDGFDFESKDCGKYKAYILRSRAGKEKSDLVWNGLSVCKYYYKAAVPTTERPEPKLPVTTFDDPVHYGDVADLVALDVTPQIVSPGQSVDLTYYWKLPHRWKYVYRRPMVFSHMKNGELMLSDDHRFLSEYEHKYLYEILDGELFLEKRTLVVPEDAPTGEYMFEVGLHFGGRRVSSGTRCGSIKIRKDAARFRAFEVK